MAVQEHPSEREAGHLNFDDDRLHHSGGDSGLRRGRRLGVLRHDEAGGNHRGDVC